eukprot:3703944-Rhodomonas_salina.1
MACGFRLRASKRVSALGLWVCGSVGLWVCGGFVGLWVCGFVGLWVCGSAGLWAVVLWRFGGGGTRRMAAWSSASDSVALWVAAACGSRV